jgi:hypothetical protein
MLAIFVHMRFAEPEGRQFTTPTDSREAIQMDRRRVSLLVALVLSVIAVTKKNDGTFIKTPP